MSDPTKFPFKDHDENDDYKLSWAARLAPDGDSIVASSWEITSDNDDLTPLVLVSTPMAAYIFDDGMSTVFWAHGGTVGKHYTLRNEIETAQGRRLFATLNLAIKHR